MTKMKNILLLFFMLLTTAFVTAQEQLVPLAKNPVLSKANHKKLITAKSGTASAVKLPFADDFSYNSLYPSRKLWSNRYVFVNKGFAVNPVTIGVATFDAVNDTGAVYPYAMQFPFVADSLTSNSIRLDSAFGSTPVKLSPADSVYVSFYFQPQGIGNAPETEDSLILQFFNPVSQSWSTVWNHQGMKLDSFRTAYGVDFKNVMIPVTDSDYFSPDFRIRFLNKASIPNNNIPSWRSGAYDHWNIDYVYIDKDRNINDTTVHDVAWIESMQTLLLNYISMPWNQYNANAQAETNTAAALKFRSLDQGVGLKNMNQYFYVQNLDDKTFHKSTPYPASTNMAAGDVINYAPDYQYPSSQPFYFKSNATENADFEVMFRIYSNTPPLDIIHSNDTMRFYQRFYNYYAYDDGVPEYGYGLSNQGAKLAYKFTLNTPDSLQSVQMYFNQTLGAANQKYFYLTVWDDNGGEPGNIIYQQQGIRPEFENKLFKYHTYKLKHAVYVSGTFYVGWQQLTQDNLNVGFDANNDHQDKIFYNSGGSWQNSSYHGALMIRPVLGDKKDAFVGMQEKESLVGLGLFPNPVSDKYLNIRIYGVSESKKSRLEISVYSLTGSLLLKSNYKSKIFTGNLERGLYFIKISSPKGDISLMRKFIIR